MTKSLFREEVLRARSQRLFGEVRLDASPATWLTTLLIVAIVFGAAIALVLGEYPRRETVAGHLRPDEGLILVKVDAPGRVAEVRISEGGRVAAGETLFTLDRDVALDAGPAASARLMTQIREERRQANHRLSLLPDQFEDRRVRLAARRDGLRRQAERLDEQALVQEERAALAARLVTRVDDLVERGIVAHLEKDRREESRLARNQELAALRGEAARIAREIDEIDAEIAALGVERAMGEAELREQIAALEQRLAEAARGGVVAVRAPVAGMVGALLVRPGDAAAAGATALSLIPAGSELQAELFAPSRAAGFIAPGQTVRLRLDAFPYQKFGVMEARVSAVSRTVMRPEDIGLEGLLGEPVFRVVATLSSQVMEAYGDEVPLQPGMTLTGDVVLERRRLWELLLDPVLAAARR